MERISLLILFIGCAGPSHLVLRSDLRYTGTRLPRRAQPQAMTQLLDLVHEAAAPSLPSLYGCGGSWRVHHLLVPACTAKQVGERVV